MSRPSIPAAALLAGLILTSCAEENPSDDTDAGPADARERPDLGVDRGDGGRPLTACAPPLEFPSPTAAVLPLDLYTATATGGTSAYRFRLSTNQSGGVVNELTGAYLSGATGGTEDTIEVTDQGCLGSATLTIRVVEPMEVRPLDVEAAPSTAFRFSVTQGSGSFRFTRTIDGTSGTLDEITGDYQAGARPGIDVIRVHDTQTGEERDATIRIINGAVLRPTPDKVYFPVGARFRLRIEGGSGFFDVTPDTPAVAHEDGYLIGMTPGRSILAVTDTFTRQTTTLRADAIGPGNFDEPRFGDALGTAQIVTAGDLNGDSFPDAILASSEADITFVNAGALFIYAGSASGLSATPARIIPGGARHDELGRRIAVADFDGDGLLDLAAGVLRADIRQTDAGAVRIYYGKSGEFFEETPRITLVGRYYYDYFGWSVTTCDFNGDGLMDLAAGAPYAEDNDRPLIQYDQGAVLIFLGYSDGFRDDPDQILWGDIPAPGNQWVADQYLNLGTSLAAGDVDGDGACELAAGTMNYDRIPDTSTSDGLVYLFKGKRAENGDSGGLYPRPSRAFAGDDPSDGYNGFGSKLAMGDLDGDQLAELVAGHAYFDNDGAATGYDNFGAVRVWRGGPLSAEPVNALAPITSADWSWINTEPWDQAGYEIQIADADGDMRNDLIIGGLYDEVGTMPPPIYYDAGSFFVLTGRSGMMPDPTPAAWYAPTLQNGGRFGAAVGVVGDLDGDLRRDFLAFADFDPAYGNFVGAPYFVPGDPARVSVRLEFPGEASGSRAGNGLDVVGDVDGDGFADLVVGAPLFDSAVRGLEVGAAFLYRGTATGFELEPAMKLQGFSGNINYDYLGWDISRAGDFDGDTRADFAVLAAYGDRPSPFPAGVLPDASCIGPYGYDTGAVFLFKGTAGLPASEPAFAIYPPFSTAWHVAGDFDFDGDGLDDIAISSPYWDRPGFTETGGLAVYRGRAAAPGGETIALCAPDYIFFGRADVDLLGWSLTALGDVDGDGCDELASGAYNDSFNELAGGAPGQGSVRVIFGSGATCAAASPRVTTLISGLAYAQAGWSVAGGEDVTGDGRPDLLVGVPNYYNATGVLGAAILVTSEYLQTLPKETWVEGALPTTLSLLRDRNDPRSLQLLGELASERFGQNVALLRTPEGPVVAVGRPGGDISGITLSGGVSIHAFTPAGGLTAEPSHLFGGESERPDGKFGERIVSAIAEGRAVLAIGAYQASGVGLDRGAAYVIDFRP